MAAAPPHIPTDGARVPLSRGPANACGLCCSVFSVTLPRGCSPVGFRDGGTSCLGRSHRDGRERAWVGLLCVALGRGDARNPLFGDMSVRVKYSFLSPFGCWLLSSCCSLRTTVHLADPCVFWGRPFVWPTPARAPPRPWVPFSLWASSRAFCLALRIYTQLWHSRRCGIGRDRFVGQNREPVSEHKHACWFLTKGKRRFNGGKQPFDTESED